MASYGQDPVVRDIVQENQAICAGVTAAPSPEATEPIMTPSPTP
jgi:hypothetical protein